MSDRDVGMPAGAPRVAVTGARGFVGSRLVARLAEGGVPVLRLSREQPPVDAEGTLHPGLREVDVVYHLATSITPAVAERRPDLVDADHETFASMLDGLASCVRPPLVVLGSSASTVCESGGTPPFSERAPTLPRSTYATAKLRLENELGRRGSVLPSVIVRFSNVYGPGLALRQGHGVIAHWFDAAWNGRPLVVYGPPDAARDYVFVDDVVDALLRIGPDATADAPYRLFHLGSGRATQLGELLDIVRAVVDVDVAVERYPGRTVDNSAVLVDVRRAREVLGWRARTPLEAGLTSTWRWFRRSVTS